MKTLRLALCSTALRASLSVAAVALGGAMLHASALGQAQGTTAVRGRVRDASGAPLAGFAVLVSEESGRRVRLRTDREGRFATIGVDSGTVEVTADTPGYVPLTVRCRLPSSLTALVELNESESIPPGATGRCRIEPSTSDVYIID